MVELTQKEEKGKQQGRKRQKLQTTEMTEFAESRRKKEPVVDIINYTSDNTVGATIDLSSTCCALISEAEERDALREGRDMPLTDAHRASRWTSLGNDGLEHHKRQG